MSRIGNSPVLLPEKVEVALNQSEISVKGPLGVLTQKLTPNVTVEKIDNRLEFRVTNNSHHANAMSGTLRALVANMVTGVTKGFEKKLNLVGVGYRAQAQGDRLNLSLGFSHPVVHRMPKGVKAGSEKDVNSIGNRNVGKGLNLYSLEREIALARVLEQERPDRCPRALERLLRRDLPGHVRRQTGGVPDRAIQRETVAGIGDCGCDRGSVRNSRQGAAT